MIRIATGLTLALAGPALGQAADVAAIRAAADAFAQAQVAGDGAALERLLSPDFLFVRASGRIGDRRDYVAGYTAAGHALQPAQRGDPLLLRVSGDVAIVGAEAWLRGQEDGRAFVRHYRYSDVLARRDDRWLVVFEQITGLPTR